MNNTKLKIIAGILLVFLLGVFSGALGTGIVLTRRIQRFNSKTPREHKNFFVKRLSKELGLNDEQQQQAEQIFNDTEVEIRALLENSRRQFDALMDQRRLQLRELLEPDRQKKLDAFFKRLRERRPPRDRSDGPRQDRRRPHD